MNKKNMLGMNMTEWKNLSGLADPYDLTEALSRAQLDALPDNEPSGGHDRDDDEPVVKVPKALQGRDANARHDLRLGAVKAVAAARAARKAKADASIDAHRKSFGGAEPAKMSDYSEKQQARIMRKAAEKKSTNEDITYGDVWCAYLEDRGSSADEFDYLVNIAIESGDEGMAIELLAIEDQLDEILGPIGAALGGAARAAGGALAKGAGAAGNIVGQGVGGLVKGVKTAMGGGAAPGAAAGGGAPAGATPPAGAPPQVPAGATPPPPAGGAAPGMPGAQTAGGASAAPPAPGGAPAAAAPQKPGLLGKLVGGAAKAIGGAVGAAKAGYAAGKAGAQPQQASVDAEDFELFLGEEHGLTAEQYVEIWEHAFATNDVEMINYLYAMEEGLWDTITGKAKKEAAAKAARDRTMQGWAAARAVVAKHGADATKAKAVRGLQVGVKPKDQIGTSVDVPKAMGDSMESVISKQLQYSGYTDEYIDDKFRN